MIVFKEDNIEEIPCVFDGRKYLTLEQRHKGMPLYERCVELPWIYDRISQLALKAGSKLFDFGCNKSQYVLDFKKNYNLRTYGIDAKKQGKEFVDIFFDGMFNNVLKNKILLSGPYDVCTAISSIEHAGYKMHPNASKITKYQLEICRFLIECSLSCFISVPFGQRPGWAKDQSRKNFYQFNCDMLDALKTLADSSGKNYLEEIYKVRNLIWEKSDRMSSRNVSYRDRKGGASSISLISIW